jgi:hypothetical protein
LAKVTNTVEEVTEVTLTLSREEAEVVAWVFGGISGISQPRNVTSAIWDRLKAAGISYGDLKEKWVRPVIEFKEKIPAKPALGNKCMYDFPNCTNSRHFTTTYSSINYTI